MADFEKVWAALEILSPVYFADRAQEFAALEKAFFVDGTRTAAVIGVGGIGKTSFVLEFGQRYRELFPCGSVFLQARAFKDLKQNLTEIIGSGISRNTSLCALDDFELLDNRLAKNLINDVNLSFPNCKILLASRRPVEGVELTLKLSPLSLQAMMDIWASNLLEISSEDAGRLYAAVGGSPLAATLAGRLVRDERYSIEDFERYLHEFQTSGIVDPEGEPIRQESKEERELVSSLVIASDEVLRYIEANPNKINELSPRGFEELVAELLARQGYEIQLTPITRDGGKDIYAARRDPLGTFLYIVECKKYAPHRPVDVGVVRHLYGVVQEERVSGGIIATTSYFTKDAKEFRSRVQYQVSLKDYIDIQKWLREVVRFRS